jgi:hypothetical protein
VRSNPFRITRRINGLAAWRQKRRLSSVFVENQTTLPTTTIGKVDGELKNHCPAAGRAIH